MTRIVHLVGIRQRKLRNFSEIRDNGEGKMKRQAVLGFARSASAEVRMPVEQLVPKKVDVPGN